MYKAFDDIKKKQYAYVVL